MSKLSKCPKCGNYTLAEICKKCKVKTKEAGQKYKKIKWVGGVMII